MAPDDLQIFVYGLLMSGQSGFDELGLARRSEHLGPARIYGRLYDLGAYPGLILGGPGIVRGEWLRVSDSAVLTELDAYELYDPLNLAESDYRRVRTKLLGTDRTVWTYVYLKPLTDCPIIASGDWRNR